MSGKAMTLGERLARLEALLEGMAMSEADFRTEVRGALEDIRKGAEEHRQKTEADEKALAALKNRGIGLLIGVGLAGSAMGAALGEALSGLLR